MVFGVYLSRYVKKAEDFTLAGRSLNKWVIAGTLMATNVAAIYLVGLFGMPFFLVYLELKLQGKGVSDVPLPWRAVQLIKWFILCWLLFVAFMRSSWMFIELK